MTSSDRRTHRRRPSWPIHLIRLVVAVEVVAALLASVYLGFVAAVGVAFGFDDADGGTDVIGLLLLLAVLVVLALLLAFVVISIRSAARLDTERARTVLTRAQWTVVVGVPPAVASTGDWLGFPLLAVGPLVVLLGCAGGALAALQRLRARVTPSTSTQAGRTRVDQALGMTSTIPQRPVAPRSPRPVVAVRILVGVQAAVSLVGISMLGLIAAIGFGLTTEGKSDRVGLVVGLVALFVVLLAFTCGLIVAASRLGRGQESARLALVAMQAVLLIGVLLLTRVVGGFLSFDGFPAPAIVLGVTALGALVALLSQPTRLWCRRF